MSTVQFEQVQAPAGGGYGVAASRVEQVRVAGRPAAYAKEAGAARASGTRRSICSISPGKLMACRTRMLHDDNGVGLSREELIRIAESVR